jgi:hypothetical protein
MNSTHALILVILIVVWLASWLGAVMSIASPHQSLSTLAKATWIAAALIFPIAGPLLWFVSGRSTATKTA